MNKICACAIFISAMSSFSAFSANTNTDAILVQSIKADYAADNGSGLYYYTFKSDKALPGGCGTKGKTLARSGDANINKILQMAYALDAKVKIGVGSDAACTISTAVVDDTF